MTFSEQALSRLDTAPKTDLGVVAAAPATATESLEPPPAAQSMDASNLEQRAVEDQADLPPLETSEHATGNGSSLPEQGAEDLPAVDGGTEESTEESQGDPAAGAASDDS